MPELNAEHTTDICRTLVGLYQCLDILDGIPEDVPYFSLEVELREAYGALEKARDTARAILEKATKVPYEKKS